VVEDTGLAVGFEKLLGCIGIWRLGKEERRRRSWCDRPSSDIGLIHLQIRI